MEPKTNEKMKSVEQESRAIKEYKRENGVVRVIYKQEQEEGVNLKDLDLEEQRQLQVKDIIFTQNDGKEFAFSTLLPSYIDLVEFQGFYDRIAIYLYKSGAIKFSKYAIKFEDHDETAGELGLEEFLKIDGSLFMLLHEIGHITQADEKGWDRYNELRNLAIDDKLEDRDVEDYISVVLRMEKQAHAFAIKELRRLRRAGIELEPSFKKLENLNEMVRGCLDSYEVFVDRARSKMAAGE